LKNLHESVIALIPARGGSKGVIRKNMRIILGTPLIGFTIRAAIGSKYINEIYVSSENDSILKYAIESGVKVITRPADLASDNSAAADVVKHFISLLPEATLAKDPYLVYLQPTSPLRTSYHIDDALEKLVNEHARSLISVIAVEKSPYKMFSLNLNGRLQSLFDERLSNSRRQDLPLSFLPNGALYVFRISEFILRDGFPSNGALPYIMNSIDSLDIDVEDDLLQLEKLLGEK